MQADLGKLGTQFRKEVDTIATQRQAQRDEIEANYQELKNKIESESPLGSHAGANEAMARFSADAAQKALEMNRRMRAGDIEPSANTAFMTNLKSSTENMFKVGQDFQNNYKEVMDRHLEGGAGAAEELAYLEAAELFNAKGEPFVGADGQVFLAVRGGDGKLDTQNPISLAQAQAAATQRVDKFDMSVSSAKVADALDKPWVEAVRSGKVKTVEDARNNPAFNSALEKMIDADLSTPSALTSILLDNASGYEYDITGTKTGDNVIQAKYNENSGRFEPVLTEAQEDAAKNIYADTILAQIGRKETAVEKTQEWELNRGEGKKEFRDNISMASKLYRGSADEIMAAREYFVGLNSRIKNITRTLDGVIVNYIGDDGQSVSNTVSFKTPSGSFKTEADFIRSLTELTGDGDVDDAIRRLNIRGNKPTGHSSTEGASRTVTKDRVIDKGYGEIELDIAGQDKLVTIDTAVDDINVSGEVFAGNTSDRRIITDGFTEVANEVFGNLSGDKTSGMVVGAVDDDYRQFEIYIPSVMTGPLYLQVEENDEMMKTRLKNAMKQIYDSANLGKTITPNDLAEAMGQNPSSRAFQSRNEMLYKRHGHSWNGGDGEFGSGGQSLTTTKGGGASSTRFNK